MRKIPTLFVRDPGNRKHVTDEVTSDCLWVFKGEGTATRKYDGTCCLVRTGKLYRRHEVKPGKFVPADFECEQVDHATGKAVGWLPVGEGPEDKWHREAFSTDLADGTYELVGPKVQGNPEGYESHTLISHAKAERYPAMNCPKGYAELAVVMATLPWEGIVWHHPDGRMAKLKRRDFV